MAKEIEKNTDLKLVNNCLYKDKDIVEQSKLNKEERLRNIQNAYKLRNNQKLDDKKVLLIDDIYTTGSTVNECAKVLKNVGMKKIGVLTIAKD